MKKITFTVLLTFTFLLGLNAQDDCASAIAVLDGSTTTVTTLDGTPPTDVCGSANGAGQTAGEWYSYTATGDGAVTISTDLPQNDGVINSDDTRVIIYSGTCAALACEAENDDISATNYLSFVTFPVTNGTTYYFVFDDRWSGAGFDFTLNFDGCAGAVNFGLSDFSNTTADVEWDNIGDFEIEFGLYPYTLGSGGTTVPLTGVNSYQFTGLAAGKSYTVFVRENCGSGTFSDWEEYLIGTTIDNVVSFPYNEDFEPDADQALLLNFGLSFAGTAGSWSFNSDDTSDGDTTNDYAFDGVASIFSNSTFTDADSDAWVFVGPFDLVTANEYMFSFQQRNITASNFTTPNKDIEIGVSTANDGTGVTIIGTFDDMDNTTYQLRSATYAPTADGSYYFGIHDKSSVLMGVTAANLVFVDALSVSSAPLSVVEFDRNEITYVYNTNTDVLMLQSSNLPFDGVRVYNMLGQEVLKQNLSKSQEYVSMSNLTDGIYLANLNIEGKTKTIKFIKQ